MGNTRELRNTFERNYSLCHVSFLFLCVSLIAVHYPDQLKLININTQKIYIYTDSVILKDKYEYINVEVILT